MSTYESNEQSIASSSNDERDILISRIVDGVATNADWMSFRVLADNDPTIWYELADVQRLHDLVFQCVQNELAATDRVELPGGLIDDRPMRVRMEVASRWGGWVAAAIVLVWFFGQSDAPTILNDHDSATAGILGSSILLDQAKPDQAFDQYLSSGQILGQVVGEMPDRVVIETRPMPDGTIEVLYLRQIIERQVIDHAYREVRDEMGNVFSVPVKLSPNIEKLF